LQTEVGLYFFLIDMKNVVAVQLTDINIQMHDWCNN